MVNTNTVKMDSQYWEKELEEFNEKTAAFYAGEIKMKDYKGFSGMYGSYAQKGGKVSMLRLRLPAGRITKDKLKFITDVIQEYRIERIHFTTCQTIQLHDLSEEVVCELLPRVLDAGIMVMGGGGDYPRNVMCSPLSGVEPEEYFDVLPWAQEAGEYLAGFIRAEKMPRKLKVGFSNSPRNISHATYRDLGFVAREDGCFDVYSAGGLGNNPRFGVLVAEGVAPEKILYYIKAMWLTFRAHGNYDNRGKARTRYMQEALGGADEYRRAYQEKLQEVTDSGEQLDIHAAPVIFHKKGRGEMPENRRVLKQKQDGLFTVAWHPIGGQPSVDGFCSLSALIQNMEDVELRLSPDETVYIINLTGEEAEQVLAATDDGAQTLFETSVSCIGAATCQVGLRDSQALLQECVDAVRGAGIPDKALPQIHISGCPSSCGTHQTGRLGFRGGVKLVDKKPLPAFVLYVNGCERQGQESMGEEIGLILETDIPSFLVELGEEIVRSGGDFDAWIQKDSQGIARVAASYL